MGKPKHMAHLNARWAKTFNKNLKKVWTQKATIQQPEDPQIRRGEKTKIQITPIEL